MLVLSRKKDESIMLGDNIELVIVRVKGENVRLGIKAPNNIPILRKELYDANQVNEHNREVSSSS